MSWRCAECSTHGAGGIDEFNNHPCGAYKARDEALARVTEASDDTDKAVVDAAILAVAHLGKPFSANDFRHLIPSVRSRNLIGARTRALGAPGGPIKRYRKEYVTSTDAATHGHPIAVWISSAVKDVAA